MKSYTEITACRACGSQHLIPVLNLGFQALTGVFPSSCEQTVTTGPLELVWAPDSGLLQLRHSYPLDEMYGDNYGYRSGLNQSMVEHLTTKVATLERLYNPQNRDVVLDIGSNDATTLKAYTTPGLRRMGMDPTGIKFREFYPDSIELIPDFFSAAAYKAVHARKATIITSIAMFYDLESPVSFAKEIAEILAEDGVWHFEQSYMPSMLRMNAYDTICHEHLEYYTLNTVKGILDAAGLAIIDVTMNSINGGSFAVTACHGTSHSHRRNTAVINWLLEQEERMGLNTPQPYRLFEERVFRHREDLRRLIAALNADGKRILGYGASTKGNVLLQFCNFTSSDIPAVADVNVDKHGKVTPGSCIPIISESEAHAMHPDYLLVLPWHFKNGFLEREKKFLASGGHMIFPFPEIEII